MGYSRQTYRGVGKNRFEAESDAISQFYYDNGHDCDVREIVSARFIGKHAPNKPVVDKVDFVDGHKIEHIHLEEDESVPEDQWLEEWEFELKYHS